MQVNDALLPLGKAVGIFLKTAVGGVPYDRQIDALRRGVEIVVATPGRLGDLINRGVCVLDDVEVTVLDEADQMADMGFLPEVTELLAKTPANAQRLLFSATLDGDVDTLVRRFMTDPVTHSTAPSTASVSTMDHHLLLIPPHDKFAVAASIAARPGRTMLFARTQLGVDRLVEQLARGGRTGRWRCTAARPSGCAPRPSPSSRRAGWTCWSPPTWRPGASTSTGSRWCCTSTRRRTRRTTCTGRVVPPGPASRARWPRWCCPSSAGPRWRCWRRPAWSRPRPGSGSATRRWPN